MKKSLIWYFIFLIIVILHTQANLFAANSSKKGSNKNTDDIVEFFESKNIMRTTEKDLSKIVDEISSSLASLTERSEAELSSIHFMLVLICILQGILLLIFAIVLYLSDRFLEGLVQRAYKKYIIYLNQTIEDGTTRICAELKKLQQLQNSTITKPQKTEQYIPEQPKQHNKYMDIQSDKTIIIQETEFDNIDKATYNRRGGTDELIQDEYINIISPNDIANLFLKQKNVDDIEGHIHNLEELNRISKGYIGFPTLPIRSSRAENNFIFKIESPQQVQLNIEKDWCCVIWIKRDLYLLPCGIMSRTLSGGLRKYYDLTQGTGEIHEVISPAIIRPDEEYQASIPVCSEFPFTLITRGSIK